MFLVKGMAFDFVLISRRSRYRAGTRYRTRGVDEKGYVANYVETEQILGFCSFSFFTRLSFLLSNDRTNTSHSLITDNGRVSLKSEDRSHSFGAKRPPLPNTIPAPVSLTLPANLYPFSHSSHLISNISNVSHLSSSSKDGCFSFAL